MQSKNAINLSGEATTDSYVFGSRINTAEYAETVLGLECLSGTSGVRYTVRGYLLPGTTPYAIASGTITSGGYTRLHSGLYLNQSIQVGVESECSEGSGTVTVYSLQRGKAV